MRFLGYHQADRSRTNGGHLQDTVTIDTRRRITSPEVSEGRGSSAWSCLDRLNSVLLLRLQTRPPAWPSVGGDLAQPGGSVSALLSHACHGFSPQVGVIFRGREVGQARMGSGKHGPRGGGASGDIPGVILTHSGSENRRKKAAVMLVGVPSRGWTGRRSRCVRTVQRPERGQDV